MVSIILWDPYERFLKGVAIAILFLCGVYYLNRGRKRDIFNEKVIMYGLSSLLFGYALGQMWMYFAQHNYPGTFENNTFYALFDITTFKYAPMLGIFTILSTICLGVGVVLFMLAFEIIFKRTKYFLTIYFTVILVLVFIFPYPYAISTFPYSFYWIYFFWLPFSFLNVVIFFMYTKWSRLEFKAIASFLIFGFVLIGTGAVLGSAGSKILNVYPLILSPILLIMGSFIVIIPTIINPRIISRTFFYWIFFGIIVIAWMVANIIISIIFSSDLSVIISNIISTIFSVVISYLILRDIKSNIILEREKSKNLKHPDILEMFIKPTKFTEEEVSISKEKKICLVCKGKISGYNLYICSNCETFYCEKCARILENMENACWVCNTPFDDSKPSKPFKKEEEDEVEVEEKLQKELKSKE
ncbi:MAG: hypothetical protein V3V33_06870 [Candidatus Lokiarchaeia archaeon]